MKRFITLGAITILIISAAFYWFKIVPDIDDGLNAITPHTPYKVLPKAQTLHDTLLIADMHADTLLWRRNPEKRQTRGHVDFPRLREGGVDIQFFSAVTKSPAGLNFDENDADAPDKITQLAIAQLWPIRTWGSIYERAVYQAQRLQKLAKNPDNKLAIAYTKSDLNQPGGTLIGLLLTEGSHPLEGQIDNIDRLFDAGYRIMGLQHFFDNELGGSMHGRSQAGLTEFGRQAIRKMTEKNIIIDVAHSSEAVTRDVLALTQGPVIISHGGLISLCPQTKNRNLPDDILLEIARRGGLLGIGYFDGVICDITPDGIAEAIMGAANLLGENSIALGSDFDGTVTTTLDTSELAAITQALLDKQASEGLIRKVMGGNVKRFLLENLPD